MTATTRGFHGPTPERLELARRARALRANGMLHREIADELDISRSYAAALIDDPDGTKARARKESYQGVCVDCGGPTSGSEGPTLLPVRCSSCRHQYERDNRYWTRERIIDAIQRFAAVHGRPPRANEWIRCDRENSYPARTSVYVSQNGSAAPFASWADAIAAAGYERPYKGSYSRTGEAGLRRGSSGGGGLPLLEWLREQKEPARLVDFYRPRGIPHQSAWRSAQTLRRRGLVARVADGLYIATSSGASG